MGTVETAKGFVPYPKSGYRHELLGVHVGDPYGLEEAHREEGEQISDRVNGMAHIRNPAGFTFYPRTLVELTDTLTQRKKRVGTTLSAGHFNTVIGGGI